VKKAFLTLLALTAIAGAAGCGDQNAVGSQSLLNFTPAPSPRALPSPSPSAQQQAATKAPTAQHSNAAPAPTMTVTISADTTQAQLSPQSFSVVAGTIVKWVNHDSVARGVMANGGAFKSPSIPPGGSWSYTFTVKGTYDYQDSTRPYVTGEVVVK
jgi:plastocyanin